MRNLSALITLATAALATGCGHHSNAPAAHPSANSETAPSPSRLMDQHSSLGETVSGLVNAYEAMVDPNATEDQQQEAEMEFRFWVLHLRLWLRNGDGQGYFERVRGLISRDDATRPGTTAAGD